MGFVFYQNMRKILCKFDFKVFVSYNKINKIKIIKLIKFFTSKNYVDIENVGNFNAVAAGHPLHFARQRSEGGAYRQTRVEAGFTVNSRAAASTLASITWCVYSEVEFVMRLSNVVK